MISSRRIWVTWQFEGFHQWPDAPPHRAYLGVRHRHLFKIRVELEVFEADREVEFHDVLDLIRKHVLATEEFGPMSCEHIAEQLLNVIETRYPGRMVVVDVSEDGECGATVTYLPPSTNQRVE